MTDAGAAEFAVVAESWFDGERRHGGPATFLVKNGRVAVVTSGDHGAALAQRGLAVERGAFLMPGLVDAQVHLFLDGALTDPKLRAAHVKQPLGARVEAVRISARQALRCGVTTLRDAIHARAGLRLSMFRVFQDNAGHSALSCCRAP